MAPHMAASPPSSASLPPSLPLPPPPSLPPFLSLPSTHLRPRGATNLCCLCCHSLYVLSVCFSFSHYFHQSFLSLSLCCAVRLQLPALDYRDMTERGEIQIHAQAHSDTPTPTFHTSLSLSGFSNTLCCFFRRCLSFKLGFIWSSLHNCWIKHLSEKCPASLTNKAKRKLLKAWLYRERRCS